MLIIKKMFRKNQIPYLVVENSETKAIVAIPLDLHVADRINKYLSKIIHKPAEIITNTEEEAPEE